eukprot:913891-Pyramimonas_sp.AAC.1
MYLHAGGDVVQPAGVLRRRRQLPRGQQRRHQLHEGALVERPRRLRLRLQGRAAIAAHGRAHTRGGARSGGAARGHQRLPGDLEGRKKAIENLLKERKKK